jgi:capsule polysaccharide export protein KpsE/RkpR
MTPQDKKELDLPMTEELPVPLELPAIFESRDQDRFLDPLIILAKHKSFILYFVLGAIAVSVAGSLLMSTYYTAEVKILPPQQGQSFASAMLDQLGALAPLLGASSGMGLKNPSDVYIDMLKSRAVADNIIDRFQLMSRYNKRLREDTRKRLEGLSEINAGKDGVITIDVDDTEPAKAAEIANAYVDELTKLTKRLAITDAGKRRLFFEAEAEKAKDDLAKAEHAMKETQERTGIVQLDSQARVMLESYAMLQAQVTSKQVEIDAMRSYATPNNPDLIRKEQELTALRTELARYKEGLGGGPIGDIALEKVPAKMLEYVDRLREVKYREALLQVLLKQYEIARIDEGRDSAQIQVFDKAQAPERKSRPHRGLIVISCTLLAFVLACLGAYGLEALERAKDNPQHLARLQLLKFYLFPARNPGNRGLQAR